MRPLPLIVGICLVLFAIRVTAVLPDGTGTGATRTSAAGAGATGTGAAGTSGTNATGRQSGAAGNLLLCNGLLGSGLFQSVLTVAPMTAARASDPKNAIQFGPIWSDSHQATVGQSIAPLHQSKPVSANVKLPIAFSAVDRQQFEAAGWKQVNGKDGHGTSFCLENTGGLFCVTGVT